MLRRLFEVMLSTGAGEMDRLRAGNLALASSGERAAKDAKAVQEGDSFPEMLESIQKDSTGKTPAKEALGEGQTLSRAEDAPKASQEQDGRLAGGWEKSPKAAAEDSGEIEAALSLESALLLQAESPQISSIDIVIADIANIAGEEAEAKPDATFEPAALGTIEKEAGSVAMPAKIELAEAEKGKDTADASAFEEIKLFGKTGEGKPGSLNAASESAESPIAAAEGDKNAESEQEKAFFSVRDLRAGERLARAPHAGEAPAAQGLHEGADIETHLHFNSSPALEGDGLAGKEGGNAGAASGFFSQVARSGGEGHGGTAQGVAGASFAERLASELRSSAPDIVRAGQIVLRNGGEGTIRLALHPETLGAVRIHLEMSGEKRVSGKITVSSREAWDAFSGSMESLVAAFADEGFDAAGFDLSWAGRDSGGAAGAASAPFYASSVPDVMPDYDLADDYSMASAARHSDALYAVDIFA